MVSVSLYAGGGKAGAGDVVSYGLRAMGTHNASYDPRSDSCGDVWPRPSLQYAGVIYSGQRVRGHVCFQIAKNDARTLMLYTGNAKDPSGFLFVQTPNPSRSGSGSARSSPLKAMLTRSRGCFAAWPRPLVVGYVPAVELNRNDSEHVFSVGLVLEDLR
jgi:hypothetical protein